MGSWPPVIIIITTSMNQGQTKYLGKVGKEILVSSDLTVRVKLTFLTYRKIVLPVDEKGNIVYHTKGQHRANYISITR